MNSTSVDALVHQYLHMFLEVSLWRGTVLLLEFC